MNILGISAFYHDSAACLIQDGRIVAAAQEERFTRKKHDSSFPTNAVNFCLKEGGMEGHALDLVAFYDKPILKFERILETYLAYAPLGIRSFIKSMPVWIKEKLWTRSLIEEKLNYQGKILFPEHHESHAASAFYPSPFQKAAFLVMDGVGEWATCSYGLGEGNKLRMIADIQFPHSLGLLYSAFTYYTGFKVNSGEYKVMGLAPYGEPKYTDLIMKHLIDLKEDGSFRLNMDYFNYGSGLTMTSRKFHRLFGGEPRKPESKITQKDMDLARSIQDAVEIVILKIARHVRKETGCENLCLAGGVALNCVANGKLLRENIFKNIWIQPAAGDAGGALGAAQMAWYQYLGNERKNYEHGNMQKGSFLGPSYEDGAIRQFLEERQIPFDACDDENLAETVADYLNQGKVVGWFQGKMEFGPRALGCRSILGDPRSEAMQKVMNLKIKYRESFRPFAPSVMRENVSDYFELEQESPYMLLVAPVRKEHCQEMSAEEKSLFGIDKLNVKRSSLPAITHVDYSARIQTVTEDTNPRFYRLLAAFQKKHGCPVLVNTSFNVRGEPIVCTPEDAYRCFMRTEMDYLVLGNFILAKDQQKTLTEDADWRKEFVLD